MLWQPDACSWKNFHQKNYNFKRRSLWQSALVITNWKVLTWAKYSLPPGTTRLQLLFSYQPTTDVPHVRSPPIVFPAASVVWGWICVQKPCLMETINVSVLLSVYFQLHLRPSCGCIDRSWFCVTIRFVTCVRNSMHVNGRNICSAVCSVWSPANLPFSLFWNKGSPAQTWNANYWWSSFRKLRDKRSNCTAGKAFSSSYRNLDWYPQQTQPLAFGTCTL